MRGRSFFLLLAGLLVAPIADFERADAATITGMVIGDGARPVGGALVQVVEPSSGKPCETRSADDGTFTFSCDATGVHSLRASHGNLKAWQVDDVELAADREVYLNFVLMAAAGTPLVDGAATGSGAARVDGAATAAGALVDGAATAAGAASLQASAAPDDAPGFWTRPIPNPVVGNWGERSITLRVLAIVVAVISFPLGGLTMLALGRRFGIKTRKLSADEVGEMVLNPIRPTVGERVTPVATVGARGASADVSYGADEIAAALEEGRYGLVFTALVIAPGLFAAFSAALALAMLIDHETYLLLLMLLVSAGFVLTPVIIAMQAITRRKGADPGAAR